MSNTIENGALKAFIERAERLQRERDETDAALKDLFAEVKGNGFDVAIFKDTLKIRRQDSTALAERGAILSLYLEAAK